MAASIASERICLRRDVRWFASVLIVFARAVPKPTWSEQAEAHQVFLLLGDIPANAGSVFAGGGLVPRNGGPKNWA